ncbi:YutD family protein [Thermoflavimicrobium dichotomicum]|uniref:YutD family protein n=1 Tax=Thermoflavimicrobium dichotomicum TaxID=46223 RepID=UPI000B82B9A8|nr:YutD family protein [Thermoflavimicrobium dichotomicum]
MDRVEVQGITYELLTNYRDAWNPEAFKKRYSEILNKYDFIVGDWGYGQLRLKGFFHDHHVRATTETKISYLEEYLNEFCNFGCAYFVLRRVSDQKNP